MTITQSLNELNGPDAVWECYELLPGNFGLRKVGQTSTVAQWLSEKDAKALVSLLNGLSTERARWADLAHDENYQYAGGPIHRRAVECRNEDIDQLKEALKLVADAAGWPAERNLGLNRNSGAWLAEFIKDERRELMRNSGERVAQLEELVQHLWLHTGRAAVRDMTTEHKRLFYEITGDSYAQELLEGRA